MRLYTDGSCVGGNPGGAMGWAVVADDGASHTLLATGGAAPAPGATNNRAELYGVLTAMLYARPGDIVVTDSQYVLAVWRRPDRARANKDLVAKLVVFKGQDIELEWVRGHAGVEANEMADLAATETSASYLKGGLS
jgi:ribonuclease HI